MRLLQRLLAFFMVSECVEVHNELKAQRRREAHPRQQCKRARFAKDTVHVSFFCSSLRSMQNVQSASLNLSNSFQIEK